MTKIDYFQPTQEDLIALDQKSRELVPEISRLLKLAGLEHWEAEQILELTKLYLQRQPL